MSSQLSGFNLRDMMGASEKAQVQRREQVMQSNPLAGGYGDGPNIEAATSHLTYNPYYNAEASRALNPTAGATPGMAGAQSVMPVDPKTGQPVPPNQVGPADLGNVVPGTSAQKPTKRYNFDMKNFTVGKKGNGLWMMAAVIVVIFLVFYMMSPKQVTAAASSTASSVKRSIPTLSM